MKETSKRLFFGLSVQAPWPSEFSNGRVIKEEGRHLTLAFLGNHPYPPLLQQLDECPLPPFSFGPLGLCDQILFLPRAIPRVISYHVNWLNDGEKIQSYQIELLNWLESLGFSIDRRPFLPHVTIARVPFDQERWKEIFEPFPCLITGFHLYESLGNLTYTPLWSHPFLSPFEEFEHTADIAFHVRGTSYNELYLHGALALSFKYPPFFHFFQHHSFNTLDEVVQKLNAMVTSCDLKIGCPFKAISYHGNVIKEDHLFQWEMIVDV